MSSPTLLNQNQVFPDRAGVTVFICEDHTIVREGLRALLALDSAITIVGETDNGHDAIRLVGAHKPALVLMDLSMPDMNGMEATREIKRRYPEVMVIVLTVHKGEEYIRATLEAGANGYVLKDATHSELKLAIKNVMHGKTYLSPSISDKVINGFLDGSPVLVKSALDILTHRERVVLKLIAEGNPNKSIATHLSISVKTVEKHRSNLMRKLNFHNTAAITAFAIERGLVTK
ncbi:MAG: response regulator transcription factor [Gammaproteobacteria bacterium]|nr:response regulator transcription factor [Gammaproteobacteria bacterium]